MKALIFAAGLGERMRPLTDTMPKPLLPVGGKPLIAWHLEKLAAIGIRDVVINTSWLAAQFPLVLGDGAHWNLRITYSNEGAVALETGGGMHHALPLLGDAGGDDAGDENQAFIAINGDIWTDYDFARLPREPAGNAHLVLVDNPAHNARGDFTLRSDGLLASHTDASRADGAVLDESTGMPRPPRLTFTGIGVYRPSLFEGWRSVIGNVDGTERSPPRFKLTPLLCAAMANSRVTGEHHPGRWTDVGTPERLAQLDATLA